MKKFLILIGSLALATTSFAQLTSPSPSVGAPVQVTPAPTPTPIQVQSGGVDQVYHAKLVLTPAQIRALNTTPVSLIPAPAAGLAIHLAGPVALKFTYGTAAYSSGGAVVLQYHTGTVAATGTLAATAVQSGTNNSNTILPIATIVTTAGLQANAMEVTCATGDFAGSTATGTLEINVPYRIY